MCNGKKQIKAQLFLYREKLKPLGFYGEVPKSIFVDHSAAKAEINLRGGIFLLGAIKLKIVILNLHT